MELIVISDTRLKIVLTPADMERYCLNFDDEDAEDTPREALRRLFDDVRRRSGFDISDEQIFVQVWQGCDGGCELYISKSDGEKNDTGEKISSTPPKYIKHTYVFDGLPPLLAVCRALLSRSYERTSDVYAGEGGKWYLVLEGEAGRDRLNDLTFVEEYAKKHGSALANLLLSEHAKPIVTGDAVGCLAKLA